MSDGTYMEIGAQNNGSAFYSLAHLFAKRSRVRKYISEEQIPAETL